MTRQSMENTKAVIEDFVRNVKRDNFKEAAKCLDLVMSKKIENRIAEKKEIVK